MSPESYEARRLRGLLLVALAIGWLGWVAWRASVAGPQFAAVGLEPSWLAMQLLRLEAWLWTPLGASLTALVLVGASSGVLLDLPRALAPLLRWRTHVLVVASGVAASIVLTPSVDPPPAPSVAGAMWPLLLAYLGLVSCVGLLAWSADGWLVLGRPVASAAVEAGRALFAAAPALVTLHVLLGEALAGVRPAELGLPDLALDEAGWTATGVLLLAAGALRLARRGPPGE